MPPSRRDQVPSSLSDASIEPSSTTAAGSAWLPSNLRALKTTSPTTLEVNVGVCRNGLCGRYDSRSETSISDLL